MKFSFWKKKKNLQSFKVMFDKKEKWEEGKVRGKKG